MTTTSTAASEPSMRRGPLTRIVGAVTGARRFVRQVVSELRKVVRPTRKELLTYTSVVLVFVCAVMLYTQVLDLGFGKLVIWVFAG